MSRITLVLEWVESGRHDLCVGQTADVMRVQRRSEFCPAVRPAVGPRTVFGLPMQLQRRTVEVISVHQPARDREPSGGLEAALFLANAMGAALLLDPLCRLTVSGNQSYSGTPAAARSLHICASVDGRRLLTRNG